jgi:hypothetical protein
MPGLSPVRGPRRPVGSNDLQPQCCRVDSPTTTKYRGPRLHSAVDPRTTTFRGACRTPLDAPCCSFAVERAGCRESAATDTTPSFRAWGRAAEPPPASMLARIPADTVMRARRRCCAHRPPQSLVRPLARSGWNPISVPLRVRPHRPCADSSTHLLSGNFGHLPVTPAGQRHHRAPISGEGKDDRLRSAGGSVAKGHESSVRRALRRRARLWRCYCADAGSGLSIKKIWPSVRPNIVEVIGREHIGDVKGPAGCCGSPYRRALPGTTPCPRLKPIQRWCRGRNGAPAWRAGRLAELPKR